MRAKWFTIGLTLAALAASIFGLRFVPQQFFPASDRPELLVDLKLSEASSIYATEKVVAAVEELLKGDPDIDHWTTYVGQGAVRFYLPLDVQLVNDFFAQSVIVTKSLEARERLRNRLELVLIEKFPGVVSRLSALELGPPVGWAAAVSRQRSRASARSRDRVQTIWRHSQRPAHGENQLRLDRAATHVAHACRSGSGPAAGREFASAGSVIICRGVRHQRHAIARRDILDRRRRARQ
jgi:multidrug efflux pump subunit AcrB